MQSTSPNFSTPNVAVRAISLNCDGTRFAVARGNRIEILDASTHQVLLTLESDQYTIYGLAWNPTRNVLASAHGNGVVRLWSTDTGTKIADYEYAPPPNTFFASDVGRDITVTRSADCVAWNPDGHLLVAAGSYDRVRIWNVDSHQLLGTFETKLGYIDFSWIGWNPAGNMLGAAGYDHNVWILDPTTFDPIPYIGPPRIPVVVSQSQYQPPFNAGAWSPDGKMLAVGGDDSEAAGFHVEVLYLQGQGVASGATEITTVKGRIHAMAWRPNSHQLAIGGDKGLSIWDTVTWTLLQDIQTSTVYTLAWHPEGTQLLYGGEKGIVQMIQATS